MGVAAGASLCVPELSHVDGSVDDARASVAPSGTRVTAAAPLSMSSEWSTGPAMVTDNLGTAAVEGAVRR